MARFLIEQGIKSGDRVGLLFDKGVHTYVALLAVLKINAAYVPLDASFPNERIGFILEDAGVKAIVSMSAFREKLTGFAATQIFLDEAERMIDEKPAARLAAHELMPPEGSARLPDLHLRHHRNAEGRGDRARRASAISCGWPPRSTACGRATAAIRA